MSYDRSAFDFLLFKYQNFVTDISHLKVEIEIRFNCLDFKYPLSLK